MYKQLNKTGHLPSQTLCNFISATHDNFIFKLKRMYCWTQEQSISAHKLDM